MEINNSNGPNAYMQVPHTTPLTSTEQIQNQNREAARSDQESQATATQAYEVSITQEAQDRLAADQAAQNNLQAMPQAEQADADAGRSTQNPGENLMINIVA